MEEEPGGLQSLGLQRVRHNGAHTATQQLRVDALSSEIADQERGSDALSLYRPLSRVPFAAGQTVLI